MEDELQDVKELKDITVYKPIVSPQKLKSLCDEAYKTFRTPLQRINYVISSLKSVDKSLKDLEITKNEWGDLEDNKSFKDIARRYNNKVIKDLDQQKSNKKNKKKY